MIRGKESISQNSWKKHKPAWGDRRVVAVYTSNQDVHVNFLKIFSMIRKKNRRHAHTHTPALPETIRVRWRSIVSVVGAAMFGRVKSPSNEGETIGVSDVGLDIKRKQSKLFELESIWTRFLHFLSFSRHRSWHLKWYYVHTMCLEDEGKKMHRKVKKRI